MTFGEAIRVGAQIRPQCFGGWWKYCGEEQALGSCATGAAYEGLTGLAGAAPNDLVTTLQDTFPGLRAEVFCPVCRTNTVQVIGIAEHLNDRHRWTRERIADWADEVLA